MKSDTSSSILYQNSSSTVFLVDIPASIACAQDLSPQSPPDLPDETQSTPNTSILRNTHKTRHILSSPPLKQPYAVQSEPKTETARAKVLAQIPQSERGVHEAIRPLVLDALSEIRQNYSRSSELCLPRHFSKGKDDFELPADPEQNEGARSKGLIKIREGKSTQQRRKLLKRQYDNVLDGEGYKLEFLDRQAFSLRRGPSLTTDTGDHDRIQHQPPLILSPGRNRFEDGYELCNKLVKNTSSDAATIELRSPFAINSRRRFCSDVGQTQNRGQVFIIPPLSRFILCDLSLSEELDCTNPTPIPDLGPEQKFNLILLDPPWANRSVRRSGHYQTQTYLDNEVLMRYIFSVLAVHSYSHPHPPPRIDDNLDLDQNRSKSDSNLSIAAIWITNSAKSRAVAYSSLIKSGFSVREEWVWIKTTIEGEPVTPLEGLWRKPYEVLVIGKKDPKTASGSNGSAGANAVLRRVIAAVPDVHSRKPNLKAVFERIFFTAGSGSEAEPSSDSDIGAGVAGQTVRYSALEVFARNLTAGWWACGNEVLKFNSESWWVDE